MAGFFAGVLSSIAALPCAMAEVLFYPRPESLDDARGDYPFQLLQLALIKAGSGQQVVMSPHYMQQNRSIIEVAKDTGKVHITATMTSVEREQQLLPVRIPISKGLIGWRLLLVRHGEHNLYRDVRAVADLAPYRVAQGHDWPDLAILRANGADPAPVSSYNSLFGMLKAGRIDYLPRSVQEIWAEAAHHPDLAIEPYLVLRYPAADYFFVNRNNTRLAEQIRLGLEAAIADGSMDQLFYRHYGALLREAALDKRRVIELANPLLPPETPLARKELWFRLEDLKKVP
ncbi:transporter substrate-binding domain-containing protein [Duganella ginsengisoli]|uniref:Transporter substrate-binding domain-containing protein n=2 Tax=Pseudoduganella ginsengisoli TaxID=1462440 RepID=A0A6L6PZM3_9BURK|nr:transporter substrate-binding domain-containing protein [Pseudoduganella ginsengisoli]